MDYCALKQGDMNAVEPAKPWDWNRKWTHLFLTPRNRRLLDDLQSRMKWQPFHAYGRVEVGVVTGDNDFFILSQGQTGGVDANHLAPIVTSSKDLRGIKFGVEDFRQIVSQNRPAFLLKATEAYDELPANVRAYVDTGEARHVNARYKCRIREPWYAVPSLWECDALLLRQAGQMPRLVHLSRKCTATDTIHRVRWKAPSLGRRHAVSFLNTITLLSAELTGRSYGGGVLELMPSEANKLPLPDPAATLDDVFDVVDERVRSRMFRDAVSVVDDAVLPDWLSADEREAASAMLAELVRRRSSRDNAHN
jgi:adenine-specific DNA-methyltransferase